MKNKSKKILGITLSTATVLSSLTPLSVLADNFYTVSFNFADGYTAAANGHEVFVYRPEDTNKENPNVAVLREDTTDKGTANCTTDTSCTIVVSDGVPTKLYLGGTPVFEGDNHFNFDTTITGDMALTIKNEPQVDPQQQGYTVHFDGEANNNRVDVALGNKTVQIEVSGKNISGDRTINLESTDMIILHGFDSNTMEARIFEGTENGFQMQLSVNENNETYIVNPNGGIPGDIHFEVRLKDNNNDPQTQQPGTGDHFDGRAYLVWSCKNGGVCYSEFTNIPSFDDGNSTFYKASDIIDSRTGEQFDVSANKKFFTPKKLFDEWVTNNSPVDFSKLDINKLIGENGIDYQPLGEPEYANAYVSYGDRNFKVVVYNDNYKGISIGDLTELNYYPSSWKNPFLRRDQFDISNTTVLKPAMIDAILLEKTLNIKALDYNGFEITKLEAVGVPSDAVSITKENEEWKLVFSSNFYDNVLFKATDSNGETSYFQIKRFTIDGWINNINNKLYIYAEYYFDRSKSYSDFEMTAKIEYKNGNTKNVKLTPYKGIDDGMGNITDAYEADEEHPKFGPAGKGLKKALFVYKLQDNEAKTIKNIYFNLEYKGSTSSNYAGTFAGSGKGVLANLYQGEE